MEKLEKLQIFITWSGERSLLIAEALRDWLPNVFQLVEPWLSAGDVNKGEKWRQALDGQLEKANFGIICLTPENLTAPWILFEAGALSKKAGSSVCTYLFGLTNLDIKDPLAQFQHTESNREDTCQLVKTINKALGENALPIDRVDKAFQLWWPYLEKRLENIPERADEGSAGRDSDEKIDEILTLVREQNRAVAESIGIQSVLQRLLGDPLNLLKNPYAHRKSKDLISYGMAGRRLGGEYNKMMDEDLQKFARLLQERGFDAEVETISGPKGMQICLRIGDSIYPLWELNLRENEAAVASLDFDSIKGRRKPNWTIAIPD